MGRKSLKKTSISNNSGSERKTQKKAGHLTCLFYAKHLKRDALRARWYAMESGQVVGGHKGILLQLGMCVTRYSK